MKRILLLTLGICLVAVSAPASTVLDFTQPQYNPGVNQPTKTVFDVLGDIDITFTAQGEAGSNPSLSWFTSTNPDSSGGNDGFGVINGGGYEYDEIELPEIFLIEFSDTVVAHSFDLTDYFIEQRSGSPYSETGLYSINGGAWEDFHSADTSSGNGLFTLALNKQLDSIAFTALGDIAGSQDHEFSVAGAEVSAVPIPSAILLLGSGLIGLAGIRKKFKR
jgi:hypothetical protein